MITTTVAPIPAGLVVSPDDLISRFCYVSDVGDLANPTLRNGVLTCVGCCGFEGGDGDSWVVGFHDGYDFIDYLSSRGWSPLTDKGRWPLEVFATFAVEGVFGVVEYRKGDLTISQFDSEESLRAFCERLS